jgi:hypothetical protein
VRIIPTLAKTVAAAAVTIGLVAGAPAAQAAPLTAPAASAAHGYSVGAAVATKKAAKAKTRLSASAPSEVKAGDDLTITAKLTRKSGKKYKAYAKKKLLLVLLDAPEAQSGGVIATKKTGKKGKVTFLLDTTDPSLAGKTFDFLVAYEGGSKAKRSESDVFSVSITR